MECAGDGISAAVVAAAAARLSPAAAADVVAAAATWSENLHYPAQFRDFLQVSLNAPLLCLQQLQRGLQQFLLLLL